MGDEKLLIMEWFLTHSVCNECCKILYNQNFVKVEC